MVRPDRPGAEGQGVFVRRCLSVFAVCVRKSP